jgi:hypothetical protein
MALLPVEADEADELYEPEEADESLWSDLPAQMRMIRPPTVATGRGLYRPRPQTQYVTQAQLQAALARVSAQERTNANAIRQVSSRVSTTAAAVNKEASDRKKETGKIRSNLSQTQQLSAILPFLTQPSSLSATGADVKDTAGNTAIPSGTQLLKDGSNTLSLLLPIFLLSSIGEGGSAAGGGLFGGGSDNFSLLFPLILIPLLTKR